MALGSIIGGFAAIFGPKQKVVKFDSTTSNKYLNSYLKKVNKLFTNTPTVTYTPVSSTEEASRALKFNMSNMENFQSMATESNYGATQDKLNMLSSFMPGWEEARDQAHKTNMSLQRGEIPADVQSTLARNAGLTSVLSGQSSSPSSARGTLARDLGLTSLSLTTQGQQQSQSWIKSLNELIPKQVSAFDTMQFSGLSTSDALNTALANSKQQLQADSTTASLNLAGRNTLANALTQYTSGKLSVLDKKYSSDLTAAGIKYENAMAPWLGAASIGAGVSSLFGLGFGGYGLGTSGYSSGA